MVVTCLGPMRSSAGGSFLQTTSLAWVVQVASRAGVDVQVDRLVVLPLTLLKGLWLIGRRVLGCGLIVDGLAVADVPPPPVESRYLRGRQILRWSVVVRRTRFMPPIGP